MRRNSVLLWSLVAVAAGYLAWQYYWPWSSGSGHFDGGMGIVLGLFICSRPAANGIDLFFQERGAFRRIVSSADGIAWFLLNGLVLFTGWLVISVGASRLTAPV